MHVNDQSPTLYEWITALNDLDSVALGKNDMALVQFIKQFLNYRLKTNNLKIFLYIVQK